MNKPDLDSIETLEKHKKTIRETQFLYLLYKDFYRELKRFATIKPIIEIGSGAGFIKKIIPNIITTDVIKTEGIDTLASAEKLPFKRKSIGSIVMLNVFHHIKDPAKALKEFDRCLKHDGRIVMIEPCNTIWSRFIYTYFHKETFDTNSGWKIKGKGRLSSANGAMPWIVFVRDQKLFAKKFPRLKLTKIKYHTPISYLVSGGVSKFQPFNNFNYKKVRKFERIFEKFRNFFSMFMTITIEKP